ncbi:hypothetical protein F4820DRAFT_37057 [Hypoxylon rubiginosum]|uniref:Uncharacterized protein n=1 Tax=Hypoxylon rubiginosum TaxID=110542 RepID=A0ACB9YS67_9PEZI|nr:hypothetical protein F4820DRAFT_37057 [Hypoxylon rubiginosum]
MGSPQCLLCTFMLLDPAAIGIRRRLVTLTILRVHFPVCAGAREIPIIANALMKTFGISHTMHTLVGDEYRRGESLVATHFLAIVPTLQQHYQKLSSCKYGYAITTSYSIPPVFLSY